jgi:hypothetical protein
MYEESWWVEDRVRYNRFISSTTEEEIQEIDQRMMIVLDAAQQPIHFVIDLRDLLQGLSLDQGLKVRHLRHAKVGWIVLMGSNQNAMLRFLTSVTFKIFGAKYKECMSLEEAGEFLKHVDPDLTDLLVKNL